MEGRRNTNNLQSQIIQNYLLLESYSIYLQYNNQLLMSLFLTWCFDTSDNRTQGFNTSIPKPANGHDPRSVPPTSDPHNLSPSYCCPFLSFFIFKSGHFSRDFPTKFLSAQLHHFPIDICNYYWSCTKYFFLHFIILSDLSNIWIQWKLMLVNLVQFHLLYSLFT